MFLLDDLLNILTLCVIPILTVATIFFVKRKLLWISPLVSTTLDFVTYIVFFSLTGNNKLILKIFGNNEWSMFFQLGLLIHIVIVIILTGVAYLIAYLLRRSKK